MSLSQYAVDEFVGFGRQPLVLCHSKILDDGHVVIGVLDPFPPLVPGFLSKVCANKELFLAASFDARKPGKPRGILIGRVDGKPILFADLI